MIDVTLTWQELELACHVAIRRRLESLRQGHKDAHGYTGTAAWDVDIEGACGEMAAAKALRKFWNGSVNSYKQGDIGQIQVRTTSGETNCLIVRPDDPENDWYVLVIGRCPAYRIVGYITGTAAKDGKWLRAPNGRPAAYFVPQQELHDVTA